MYKGIVKAMSIYSAFGKVDGLRISEMKPKKATLPALQSVLAALCTAPGKQGEFTVGHDDIEQADHSGLELHGLSHDSDVGGLLAVVL